MSAGVVVFGLWWFDLVDSSVHGWNYYGSFPTMESCESARAELWRRKLSWHWTTSAAECRKENLTS